MVAVAAPEGIGHDGRELPQPGVDADGRVLRVLRQRRMGGDLAE